MLRMYRDLYTGGLEFKQRGSEYLLRRRKKSLWTCMENDFNESSTKTTLAPSLIGTHQRCFAVNRVFNSRVV